MLCKFYNDFLSIKTVDQKGIKTMTFILVSNNKKSYVLYFSFSKYYDYIYIYIYIYKDYINIIKMWTQRSFFPSFYFDKHAK